MLDEIRKLEIRTRLSEMAAARQYASALMWLSALPMDEEDYGREVMEQVQFTRGGRVSVRNIWDGPKPALQDCFTPGILDKLLGSMGKTNVVFGTFDRAFGSGMAAGLAHGLNAALSMPSPFFTSLQSLILDAQQEEIKEVRSRLYEGQQVPMEIYAAKISFETRMMPTADLSVGFDLGKLRADLGIDRHEQYSPDRKTRVRRQRGIDKRKHVK